MGILSSPEKSQALRDNLVSRVSRGRHTGKLPFGYEYPEHYGDLPVVNAEEASTVREAFRLALNNTTISEIALLMRQSGFTGRDNAPFARSSIHAMLINPFYTGMVRLNGEVYEGKHEPIVSKVDFQRVQSFLFERREIAVSARLSTTSISLTD